MSFLKDLRFQDPEGLVNRAAFNERFETLNELYRYFWKRKGINGSIRTIDITSPVTIGEKSTGISILYGKSVRIDADGSALVENSVEYKISWTTSSGSQEAAKKLASFAPCYIKSLSGDPQNVYYLPSGTTYGNFSTSPLPTIVYQTADVTLQVEGVSVKSQKVLVDAEISNWEYVFSDNRSAYPDSGIIDDYEYQYLGIPFENACEAPKIATGEYTGTGTYGSGNPNTLTFDFEPKLVMIFCKDSIFQLFMARGSSVAYSLRKENSNTDNSAKTSPITVSFVGKSISWYGSDSSWYQGNGTTDYYFIALG